jgi:hypothetical protein
MQQSHAALTELGMVPEVITINMALLTELFLSAYLIPVKTARRRFKLATEGKSESLKGMRLKVSVRSAAVPAAAAPKTRNRWNYSDSCSARTCCGWDSRALRQI